MGSIGTSWLGSASRPSVASTAEKPISSGTKAATRAPKASSRMISVTGRDVVSALLEVVAEDLFQRLAGTGAAELLDPECRVGACAAAVAARLASTFASACVFVAGDLEFDQRRVAVGGDLAAAVGRRADLA